MVLLQESRGPKGRVLSERIGDVVGGVRELCPNGQNLTEQGVVWIPAPDSGNVAPGHPQPKGGSGRLGGRNERRIQAKLGDELRGWVIAEAISACQRLGLRWRVGVDAVIIRGPLSRTIEGAHSAAHGVRKKWLAIRPAKYVAA